MALADASHFDRLVDFLKQKRENVTFHDIIMLAEVAAQSLQGFFQAMGADDSDHAAYKALVDEKMMVIFEACSFQDITGQRVSKVVETLQHIEQRVARFADVMKAKDLDGFISDVERDRAQRKEKFLL